MTVKCTLYAAFGSRLFIVNQPNSKRCSAVSSDLFSCGKKVNIYHPAVIKYNIRCIKSKISYDTVVQIVSLQLHFLNLAGAFFSF